jgi:hypothetical protein
MRCCSMRTGTGSGSLAVCLDAGSTTARIVRHWSEDNERAHGGGSYRPRQGAAGLWALEAFMGSCAAEGLEAPDETDIRAFAQLQAQAPEDIGRLGVALDALGLGEMYAAATQEVERSVRHRVDFKGISKVPRRTYERSVSVPPDALPGDWHQTLRRLRATADFAPSILDRMEGRLGMFAWSADRHGHAVDLSDIEALKAFYGDLRHRSAAKNDGEPRWAYLRSTWEELRRFAPAHRLVRGGRGAAVDQLQGAGAARAVAERAEVHEAAERGDRERPSGARRGTPRAGRRNDTTASAPCPPQRRGRNPDRHHPASASRGCAIREVAAETAEHEPFVALLKSGGWGRHGQQVHACLGDHGPSHGIRRRDDRPYPPDRPVQPGPGRATSSSGNRQARCVGEPRARSRSHTRHPRTALLNPPCSRGTQGGSGNWKRGVRGSGQLEHLPDRERPHVSTGDRRDPRIPLARR